MGRVYIPSFPLFSVHGMPRSQLRGMLLHSCPIPRYGQTVALAADSTVWCWGRKDYGGLGNGTTTGSIIPVQVVGLDDVIAIASGDFFSAALKADNTLWTWGHNNYGQLGTGVSENSSVPVQAAISDITAIAAGNGHLLALVADGTVWGWGSMTTGSSGPERAHPPSPRPPYRPLGSIPWWRSPPGASASVQPYALTARCGPGGTTSGARWATAPTRPAPGPATGFTNMVAIARQRGQGHT